MSCQDKAGLSIEQNSSCMRADCASSIEPDPSAWASPDNKVIFPNLLRQNGDTLSILVLSTHTAGRNQARTRSGSWQPAPSPQLLCTSHLGSPQLPHHLGEWSTGCRNWPLARGATRECPGILGACGGAERTSQNRSRQRGSCGLKFTGVGAVTDAVDQWLTNYGSLDQQH